ncbi:hypothetical protein [Paenibacillus dendritiformis]|uniref:hypothetical protein n=1 Tax=Paenibacillus dendritiformis TaxID=130049 RepID=UPI001F54E65D|nr:hypothetical protein [Paenibacillus dendritiformis]
MEFLLDRSNKVEAPDIAKPGDEIFEVKEIIDQLNHSREKLSEVLNTVDCSDSVKHHQFNIL